MTMDEIRADIDVVDRQIAKLFIERMKLSKHVAGIKLQSDDPVYKPEREEQVLSGIESLLPDELKQKGRSLYTSLIMLSRELQYQVQAEAGKEVSCIDRFYRGTLDEKRVAYYGDECSWSHLAASKMCKGKDLLSTQTFDGVFERVLSGDADAGVIPVENSTAGTVREVYDLLLGSGLYISATTNLDIAYCLAAKKDSDLSMIQSVYSHPQSLSQCKEFIKKYDFSAVGYPNTAGAAKFVASNPDKKIAALCNELAVEKYGLVSLQSDIRDSKYNTTRFIKIVKQPVVGENADTVSLAMTIGDKAGILANAAAIFRDNGINMHKIESRPIPNRPSEFSLYVDFEGNLFEIHTKSMLFQLEKEFKDVCVFGNYKSI